MEEVDIDADEPHPRRQRLVRPVGPDSVVVPVPSARYTECDGAPVLYDPTSRAFQPLTPAGAVVWSRLDGRTVAEVVDELAAMPAADATLRVGVLEVIRRLRAVGLAEDADGDGAAGVDTGGDDTGAATGSGEAGSRSPGDEAQPATIGLIGRAESSDDGKVVVLDPSADPTIDPATDAPRSQRVAIDLQSLPARFVVEAEMPGPDEGTLTPLDALRVLADATDRNTFGRADALDVLAGLAERVPTVRRLPAPAVTTEP